MGKMNVDEQAYDWTPAWQAEERESLRALEAGEGRRFDDADAAIRWLLAPDDGDDDRAAPPRRGASQTVV